MEEIRFIATIGEDQVIRPPAGVLIPGGEAEVTVRMVATGAEPDIMADTRAMLLRLAAEAEALAPDLPSDMAENHDYYAHGKPRP
jgi:hypothetical protein